MRFGEKWRKDLLNKWIIKSEEQETRYYFFTKSYEEEHYFQGVKNLMNGYLVITKSKGQIGPTIDYVVGIPAILHNFETAKVVTDRKSLKKLNRLKLKEMFREAQRGPVA